MNNNIKKIKIFIVIIFFIIISVGAEELSRLIANRNNQTLNFLPAAAKRWELSQKNKAEETLENKNSATDYSSSTPSRILVEGTSENFSNSENCVKKTTKPASPQTSCSTTDQTTINQENISALNLISTTTLNYKFGMSVGEDFNSLSEEELINRFNDLASLGFGWLRFDIDWSNIQPANSNEYNWEKIDRIVKIANIYSLKLLPVLDYTPRWARSADCLFSPKCAPADPNQFAIFAAKAVQRYSSFGINSWEIWNEPNMRFFWRPAPDPQNYSELIKITYKAVKEQDQSALVISGGLAPAETKAGNIAPVDFLNTLYKNNSHLYFDAVGFHPYSYPVLPSYTQSWNAWSQMAITKKRLRSGMIDNGDANKKIWITEFGAPTGGPDNISDFGNYNLTSNPDHVTENLQAEIAKDAINTVKNYSWSGPLFWYSYQDLGIDSGTIENFFGLIRFDGTQKPTYNVFKKLIKSK
jgi:polysaccharide biosynthesis protein PslG